ncbi:hypothetical protein PPL_01552 [Heterostelium album PN500]|uniref:Ankyrin repeat protein n=1 Tax=Heterostelium pallidum (strain ATCC 26659 / Pp 5 / PN500) TaxID=670386 RepID=D3AZT9_HETP5|nr:hypothetical protein PPL_01552 [Heterostelium album PN500]EFA84563.1 hypothetical protein PPL_01552 [Heterostelium album PN500]|eukprot:XP_020436676.1 hypothetical protein PPL_01552 [Heterostelium album PN500]
MDNLFKNIINNLVIRNKIFEYVENDSICDCAFHHGWSVIENDPYLLIQYNFIDILLNQYFTKNENILTDLPQRYRTSSELAAEQPIERFIIRAINYNRLSVLKFLFDTRKLVLVSFKYINVWISYAAQRGYLEIVQYLYQHPQFKVYLNEKHNNRTFYEASKSKNIQLIEWLSKNVELSAKPISFNSSPIECATQFGNSEMVKWLALNRPMDSKEQVVELCIGGNKLDILEWLDSHGFIDRNMKSINLEFVIEDMKVETIQWVLDSDYHIKFGQRTFSFAVSKGLLDFIKWMDQRDKSLVGKQDLHIVINSYQFETIKWLHVNNYFIENAPPLSILRTPDSKLPTTLPLEIVRWVHENRTEGFSEYFFECAAMFSLEIVMFLHSIGHGRVMSMALEYAARYQKLDIVQFLHSNTPNILRALKFHNIIGRAGLDVVKFIHNNRTERCWTTLCVDKASKNGEFEVVKFLIENRTEGCTQKAIRYSKYFEYDEITNYLLDHKLCEDEPSDDDFDINSLENTSIDEDEDGSDYTEDEDEDF